MSAESQECKKLSISVIVKEKGSKPSKGAEGCIVKLSGKGTSLKEEKGNTVEFKDLKEGDYTVKVTFEDPDLYITPEEKKNVKAAKKAKPVVFEVSSIIKIKVKTPEGDPLPDITYLIISKNSDERYIGKVDDNGYAEVEVPQSVNKYVISFPNDQKEKDNKPTIIDKKPYWTWEFKKGDWVSRVCLNYGLQNWKKIWEHPVNKSFKKKYKTEESLKKIQIGEIFYISFHRIKKEVNEFVLVRCNCKVTKTRIGNLKILCKICNKDKKELTGILATSEEYEKFLKEAKKADHEWDTLDAVGYGIETNIVRPIQRILNKNIDPSSSKLAKFKDKWVSDHKTSIILLSRRHNLPPEILGGIAWTEVGGAPDVQDYIIHPIRAFDHSGDPYLEPLTITKQSKLTTFGDVQIQIQNVAKILGWDDKNLSYSQERKIIKMLEDEQLNLAIVAKFLKYIMEQIHQGYKLENIGNKEIILIGYAYNMGYPHQLLGLDKDLDIPRKKGISNYGHDLLNKKEKVLKLLGLQ